MSANRPRRPRARLLLAAACALAALACPARVPGEARGGAQPPADPNRQLGAALFDQCIRWVAQGQAGVTETRDFFIHVVAELELEKTRHRGPMRIWWKSPDKFRQELTQGSQTTTKILNGNSMWVIHPNRRVQRMHGTPEGLPAIRQLMEDRDRMGDLAKFITLSSLKGPGVVFTFAGEKVGSGDFAGRWLKVTRTAPGVTRMHFWLAYDRDDKGAYVAKWPGIVRVDGDPRQRIPTEDFVLRSWADSKPGQPRAYRYPKVVEAFSRSPGRQPARFLRATVEDIKINIGVPDSRFADPTRR